MLVNHFKRSDYDFNTFYIHESEIGRMVLRPLLLHVHNGIELPWAHVLPSTYGFYSTADMRKRTVECSLKLKSTHYVALTNKFSSPDTTNRFRSTQAGPFYRVHVTSFQVSRFQVVWGHLSLYESKCFRKKTNLFCLIYIDIHGSKMRSWIVFASHMPLQRCLLVVPLIVGAVYLLSVHGYLCLCMCSVHTRLMAFDGSHCV